MSTGRWLFAVWMLVAALSSGPAPFRDLARIATPIDFKYDFISAHWIAHGHPAAALDRETADALGERLGTQRGPFWPGAPAQTHPPPASLLVLPLVPLGYHAAALVWCALSLIAVAWLARLLLAIWQRAPRLPPWRRVWPAALAIAAWPPTLFNLGFGQWSILLALAVAACWWRHEQGAPRGAAAWLAAAIVIKSTPAVALGYFALRARRVAVAAAAVVALICLGALPLTGGVGAWRAFFASAASATRIFEGWIHNTASIRGLFVRAFASTQFTTAVVDRPSWGHALSAITSTALVGAALYITWRRRRDEDAGPVFAGWTCLAVLLNPLAWTHNVLLLLLPAALLARDPQHPRRRYAVAVALVLLTLPRQTLAYAYTRSGELPLSATATWFLGLHAVAGLLLFVTALASAATPRESS